MPLCRKVCQKERGWAEEQQQRRKKKKLFGILSKTNNHLDHPLSPFYPFIVYKLKTLREYFYAARTPSQMICCLRHAAWKCLQILRLLCVHRSRDSTPFSGCVASFPIIYFIISLDPLPTFLLAKLFSRTEIKPRRLTLYERIVCTLHSILNIIGKNYSAKSFRRRFSFSQNEGSVFGYVRRFSIS